MSDITFPTLPACVTVSRTLVHSTSVQEARNGKELRIRHHSAPRYRYTLNVSVRQGGSYVEAASLIGFVNEMAGRYDTFLFADPYDGATRRCRFDADEFDLERLNGSVWALDGLELVSVL